jgi:hypothetical protein
MADCLRGAMRSRQGVALISNNRELPPRPSRCCVAVGAPFRNLRAVVWRLASDHAPQSLIFPNVVCFDQYVGVRAWKTVSIAALERRLPVTVALMIGGENEPQFEASISHQRAA